MVIDIPAASQVYRQVIRKAAEPLELDLDPAVRLYTVEVSPPLLDKPCSDLQRLRQQLSTKYQLSNLDCAPSALRRLQHSLRKGEWRVTVGDP